MIDVELERLRRAFAEIDGARAGSSPQPDAETVWRAVAGELDPDETRRLAERLPDDPELAREWRLALDLVRSARRGSRPPVVRVIPRWRRPAFALAASLVVVVAAATLWNMARPDAPVYRAVDDATRIEAERGADESLPREAFTLEWSEVDGALRYRLVVTDDRLELLHEADSLEATSATVPEASLETVPAGGRVLWQVDAVTNEGRHLTSPTFVATVD